MIEKKNSDEKNIKENSKPQENLNKKKVEFEDLVNKTSQI